MGTIPSLQPTQLPTYPPTHLLNQPTHPLFRQLTNQVAQQKKNMSPIKQVTALLFASVLLVSAFAMPATPWRPQGRFGKRTKPTLEAARRSSLEGSELAPVAVEVVSALRPAMCSVLGLEGYPPCPGHIARSAIDNALALFHAQDRNVVLGR